MRCRCGPSSAGFANFGDSLSRPPVVNVGMAEVGTVSAPPSGRKQGSEVAVLFIQ